jgi:outer membrane receptor for ferrienterochelin and colicins
MVRRAIVVATAAAALVLSAAPLRAQQTTTLNGRVHAAGRAVAGAVVRTTCHDAVTTTGADGTWRLGPLPAQTHELVIEHIGYAARSMSVPASFADTLRIELTPRPLTLSTLVVTAARRAQALKDVAVATEVIDREQLRGAGAADLAAVLTERTGVTLEGGHPVGAGVMLQGLGSERVLVLVDGQPLTGRLSGKLDLARVPVSLIERVEVVKGPQSTLYGSEAMGGVINIITRSPITDGWDASADVIGGSRERLDANADLTGRTGRVGYALNGAHRSIELVPGHQSDAGTYVMRWDGAAKLERQAGAASTVFAHVQLHDESQRWKSGALFHFADNLQWGARAGARVRHGSLVLSPTLYATEFRHLSRRSTLPQALPNTGEQESQQLVELEMLLAATAGAFHIDAGVEARRDAIESDRVQGATRALYAVEPFVQTTLAGGTWSIVPGARLSWSEQWGTHLTPRVAFLLRAAPALALRASGGYGFRAPSFKELYMEFLNTGAGAGYRVRGNAALQPETSRNITTSVEWAGERVYARAQAFYNRFDDFIETVELVDSSGLRLFTYGNIEDGVTYGTEIELGASWRGLRVESGYAWLVADNRDTGAPLLGRPTHSGRASISYAHASGVRATITGVFTGRTPVAHTDTATVTRNAFTRLDARVAHQLPRGFELSVGVDNVANTQPQSWPGFVQRQFHAGVGWRRSDSR